MLYEIDAISISLPDSQDTDSPPHCPSKLQADELGPERANPSLQEKEATVP